MKARNIEFQSCTEKKPMDVLEKFVALFIDKGWLNRTLRIKRHDRSYRVFCCEREFLAYRINDHWGVSPGLSGWPVCMVTQDQMIDDSEMSAFESTEPSAHDWLRCIANGDFELI
jgi:hypothetical protein